MRAAFPFVILIQKDYSEFRIWSGSDTPMASMSGSDRFSFCRSYLDCQSIAFWSLKKPWSMHLTPCLEIDTLSSI